MNTKHNDTNILDQGDLFKKQEITKSILRRFFGKKTPHCKHQCGWLWNASRGFVTNFIAGYLMRTCIKIAFSLLKKKKSFYDYLRMLSHPDSLSFAAFFGLLVGSYKAFNCIMRVARKKEDGVNSIVSGVLWSLAAFADQNSSRRVGMIYMLFARSVQVSVTTLDSKKVMKERNDYYLAFYVVWTMLFIYMLYFEQEIWPSFAHKLMANTGSMKKNDMILKDLIWGKMYKK